MPKPIKKKVKKRVTPEEEVRDIYEIVRNYYENNRNFVHLVVAGFFVIVVLIFGGFWYLREAKEKALSLQYEGYKLYQGLYQKPATEGVEKELDEALQKLMASYEKSPSPVTLLYIADIEFRLNNLDKAMETLMEFIEKYDDKRDLLGLAYYRLYMVQMRKDLKEEALKTLKEWSSREGVYLRDLALFERGRILEAEGKEEEAKEVYKNLVREFPGSPYAKMVAQKIEEDIQKVQEEKKGSPTKEEEDR